MAKLFIFLILVIPGLVYYSSFKNVHSSYLLSNPFINNQPLWST